MYMICIHICDIFEKLKILHLSLQGKSIELLKSCEKNSTFEKKLNFWEIEKVWESLD